MGRTIPELLTDLDFSPIPLPDNAVVIDAVVLLRFATPEGSTPGTGFTYSPGVDGVLMAGLMQCANDRARAMVMQAFENDTP